MELRVLRYFLMVAREENITKAAQLLHVTQPTLSRQLQQLEQELGVTLFRRGKYNISLTEDGMLLKRRAQELVALSDRTMQDLTNREQDISGEISIGCGETRNMTLLAEQMTAFRQKYPLVQFSLYSATADDIKERMEAGLLDMGLLMEPVDIGKYDFIRMPWKEKWGVLVRKDSPLGQKPSVFPEDLLRVPLLIPRREVVRHELSAWFGETYDRLEIAATYNLILNAAALVRQNAEVALCFDLGSFYEELIFVPFASAVETGAVVVWKKNQFQAQATDCFIKWLRNTI